MPSTSFIAGSLRKPRSRRGPYCCEASARATIVSEKTSAVTLIIDDAIVDKTERASSLPLTKNQACGSQPPAWAAWSSCTMAKASATAAAVISPGTSQ